MNFKNTFNSVIGLAGLISLGLSASIALAGNAMQAHEEIRIAYKTDSGLADTVVIENLAVGDSEVFVTESGEEVFVTRNEDSLDIEVAGETVSVQMLHLDGLHDDAHFGDLDVNEWVDEDGNRRVEIHKSMDVTVHCDDGEDCADAHKMVFISDDGDVDVRHADGKVIVTSFGGDVLDDGELEEVLAELHINHELDHADGEKMIVIKKEIRVESDSEDDQE